MEQLRPAVHVYSHDPGRVNATKLYRESSQLKLADSLFDKITTIAERPVSALGHSLGGVILLKTLLKYPELHLDTVFLAGSVVDEHYSWRELLDAGRVKLVINFLAPNDNVVRFGRFFLRQKLLMGGAGAVGIQETDIRVINRDLPLVAHESITTRRCVEVERWVPGGLLRVIHDRLLQSRETLLKQSLLTLTFQEAGSMEFIIPELFVERNIRARSGQLFSSLKEHYIQRASSLAPGRPFAILLLGGVGEGKTTLLIREFIRSLDDFRKTPEAAIPVWIQVANLINSANTSLFNSVERFLDQRWPETSSRPFVLLLDGVDEWPACIMRREDLNLLCKNRQCVAIYVSCRTTFAAGHYSQGALDEIFSDEVQIQDWPREEAETFAQRFIEHREPSSERQARISERFDRLYPQLAAGASMLISPLVLTMVLTLMSQNPDQEDFTANLQEIFKQVVDIWIARESYRIRDSSRIDHKQILDQWKGLAWDLFQSARLASDEPPNIDLDINTGTGQVISSLLRLEVADAGRYKVFGFWHESFLEYFVSALTIQKLRSWASGNHNTPDSFLAYPVNEVLAAFLKDSISQLDLALRRRLAERLSVAVGEFEYTATPSEEEILFLNALLYFSGRLDIDQGAQTLASVWEQRHRLLSEKYPQAYITLLSGVSLSNLFDIEYSYISEITLDPNSIENRVMARWHLMYYGDTPEADFPRFVEKVRDTAPEKWSKSRIALLNRIRNANERELRLTLFHLSALWALARHHNYHFLHEESGLIDASFSRATQAFPERAKAAQKLRKALSPLLTTF